MYRTVYDLTREELNELKENYYWQEESVELRKSLDHPLDIPNDIIFDHYNSISFTDDDFFCNQETD